MKESSEGCVGLAALTNTVAVDTTVVKTQPTSLGDRRRSSVHDALISLFASQKDGDRHSFADNIIPSRKSSAYGAFSNKRHSNRGVISNKDHLVEAVADHPRVYFLKVVSKVKAVGKFGGPRRALEEAEILSIANWRHIFRRHPFIVQLVGTFQTKVSITR